MALRLLVLWIWMAALGFKWGALPPLGSFMNPYVGFWRNAESTAPRESREVEVPDLSGTVVAEYDRRGVPHVFAQDLYGMFYAQGYATARDRLWQMDIQSRAGVGRLSEILGPNLVRFDLERRRMGIPASALTTLDLMLRDSISRVALEAYSNGVNAWISSLKPATYPIEFKLLDYAPEAWNALKSVVILKNMQWTLSQGKDDLPLTKILTTYGREFYSRLYPLRHPGAEPILPEELFPLEPKRDSASPVVVPPLVFGPSPRHDTLFPRFNPGSGSNNFVISGKRTRTGYPILANDPHLDLTLPSLWYEIQMKAGPVNAYGVSLPGLPGLVIGFTQSTAWGLTNGMDDVFDWYELRFRNDSLNEYLWKGKWRMAYRVLDTIPVRGLTGMTAVVDTQLWSHMGPVPVRRGEVPFSANTPSLYALKWTALDPSNELGAFLRMLSARDLNTFRRAARGVQTPSQNFVFAARDEIGLVHQGRVPVKHPGQGRGLVRYPASVYEWRSSIPAGLLPAARNPARGWLASANQEPVGPHYPFYLGSGFYPPYRSQRLHRLLVNEVHENSLSLLSAWDILRDDYSRFAAQALPLLLARLPDPTGRTGEDSASKSDAFRAEESLRAWDFRYKAAAVAPVFFDLWWKEFHRAVWADDFQNDSVNFTWPSAAVTVDLLRRDTASSFFDVAGTPARESAGDIARASFDRAVRRAVAAGRGRPRTWGEFRPVSIPHLLKLPSFGVAELRGDGCAECLNAQRGSHGPSWRMAVQIGRRPEAWGIYPGGQSGNPGARAYDAFVQDWLAGRAYRLLFLQWPLEIPDSTDYLLALRGKK
ncbi:MAG: penicillin acylase family protein [Fibrobacteria bacterium]|nr:penicillin acylase family protein [Fibrobacteria bacterium]